MSLTFQAQTHKLIGTYEIKKSIANPIEFPDHDYTFIENFIESTTVIILSMNTELEDEKCKLGHTILTY